jgi:hypothetical protein
MLLGSASSNDNGRQNTLGGKMGEDVVCECMEYGSVSMCVGDVNAMQSESEHVLNTSSGAKKSSSSKG